MTLNCPHCKSLLQESLYEGVAVQSCARCNGVLVDKAGLQKIAHRRETEVPRNMPTPRRPSEVVLHCPHCATPMTKGVQGKLRKITFDMCAGCTAVWLDRGELESIQLDFEMASDNMARSQRARTAAPPANAATAHAAPATAPADAAAQAEAGFRCPKCNHPQPRGTECVRCGIVFAKYEALQQQSSAEDARVAALSQRVEEHFQAVRGFELRQQYHLTEAIVGFERANRYTLHHVGSARLITWQIEESNRSGLSILGRNLFGTLYAFTMDVLDESRNCVLKLRRLARFYFYHLDVYDEAGRMIGAVRRRFSFFNRVLSIHDEAGRELARIVGPYHRPWTFLLRCRGEEAGTIAKYWSGALKELYTDADRFTIRFANSVDTRMRRLLLGATLLIDSLYFEGRKPFFRHFFDAPGVQILVVLLLAGILLGSPELKLPGGMQPPAPAAERAGAAIHGQELHDLVERRRSLDTLATAGQYTVVEVYLDSCAICRQLESGFGRFTEKRRDVVIQRVHVPEDGLQISLSGSTRQEVEEQARAVQALMEPICGTPHVEVYGPDRRPLARDVCGDKSGTKYLRRWIASETGLSVRDLLTAAGPEGATPLPAH
ncbi:MAG TPA: phospholipid scramblase-related protein [Gammaproteobacteria bacterium]|jgi:Zn-finger nucleic acid-binding protein